MAKPKGKILMHTGWARFFHWSHAVACVGLILTGFYIHWPTSFGLFSEMNQPRFLHFALAYLFTFAWVGRIYYSLVVGDWKNIVYRPIKDTAQLPSMLKYYLFLADSHPDYGKYNPGQKGMYTFWVLMVALQILTGFILYKPDMFMGLGMAMGGLLVVRMIHYAITWLFVLTLLIHVYLGLAEGWPIFASMFTGKLPAGFGHSSSQQSHEAGQ
ncbi:MAG: cytochrome b/b6 domain-containing protein [Syntrophomonadaceae bacterium]|jgi:Ni/Fe-hydrogenase 1 B-type cytochrome subunit|nr:cytochrome b/b6 domain-containing protein [Syntrophomonadaceae bacterium]MDH7497573.1 cytochrome b/b6 domain-containing protein [Syntrophomonadaceae bacterium]